jgi:exosortase family protein XrtF
MSEFTFSEFKPTVIFLVKFAAIYLVGNLVYGLFITSYEPNPDPVTHMVTVHTAMVVRAFDVNTVVRDADNLPNTLILHNDKPVLSVYEGCNGVNTFIIFLAFVVAIGPWQRSLLWFSIGGLAIIHIANIARVATLFYVATNQPQYMYFMHKYLFTAMLYAVIFVLWLVWIRRPRKNT